MVMSDPNTYTSIHDFILNQGKTDWYKILLSMQQVLVLQVEKIHGWPL
jgi:hypothetical protein